MAKEERIEYTYDIDSFYSKAEKALTPLHDFLKENKEIVCAIQVSKSKEEVFKIELAIDFEKLELIPRIKKS